MTGRVLDIATQAPVLAYVWRGNDAVAMTDANGAWSADVPAGASLRYTAVGYSTMVQPVVDGEAVYLEPVVTELDPVVVTPDRPQEAGFPWLLLGALLLLGAAARSRPQRRSR